MHHNEERKEIHHFDPTKVHSVKDLFDEYFQTGVFGGGNLGKAYRIINQAKDEGAKIFLSMAGAMVPGGMRKAVTTAMREGLVDMLVTTGANITHDLIEAFGVPHLKFVKHLDDKELNERGIDRVYDAYVQEDGFPNLEDNLKRLIDEFHEETNENGVTITSSHEFLKWLGGKIGDEDSIVRVAYEKNIPIFVPVIADSVLGLQIWLRSQFKKIVMDEMRDLTAIQDYFHESARSMALMLGGGVPKNYMLQASLMSNKQYEYGVAITMDRVETGGLSGATLTEAVSWGKFTWEAPKVTVYADTTIVFPLLVSAWLERKSNRS